MQKNTRIAPGAESPLKEREEDDAAAVVGSRDVQAALRGKP
jgi:hypothetical protein